MEIVTILVTLILGALLSAWVNHFVKRPKLGLAGSGSGGGRGPGFHVSKANIRNHPGLLGIRLGETIIFGKGAHDRIEKGISLDRRTARECRAELVDKINGRFWAPLWWRDPNNRGSYLRAVDIESGERYELMIFARLHEEPSKYFVFSPEGDSGKPKVPIDSAKFQDERQFIVRVSYSYGRQSLRFPVSVHKQYDGRLRAGVADSSGSF